MTRAYPARCRSLAAVLLLCAVLVPDARAAVPDPAYDAFQLGNYVTALKEAEKAAAAGDPAAHTLIGE